MAARLAKAYSFAHSNALPMSHPSSSLLLADEVQALLQTQRFGRTLRSYASIDSTNTAAMRWANEDAPEGSVVVADYQTAGRGRQGRTWQAEAGQNLMFSMVLRPPLPPPRLSLITLAASVAMAETVETFTTPLTNTIKWPNDVLLEGYKCCGMLLESTLGGPNQATVILGIGLNVNQSAFPSELAERATSLLLQTGRRTPRAALLADVLGRLEHYYDALGDDDGIAVRRAYTARLHGLGHPATLQLTRRAQPITGVILGISNTGALRLDTTDGVRTFHAGEIRNANF